MKSRGEYRKRQALQVLALKNTRVCDKQVVYYCMKYRFESSTLENSTKK